MSKNNFKDVLKMHDHFDLGVGEQDPDPSPRLLAVKDMERRIRFLQEELNELIAGAARNELPEVADALIDIVGVAMGTAVMMGLPWRALWDDVLRANMEKERDESGSLGGRGAGGVDLKKPTGWAPPKTSHILEAHGWVGE